MTIYQCYRCGYESHIKTIIVRHINRKNICKPKVNNINLDDCKEYILNGFSYKEYCEEIMSSKIDQKIPKYTHFGEEISPKCPQNIPKNKMKLTEISKCNFCQNPIQILQWPNYTTHY